MFLLYVCNAVHILYIDDDGRGIIAFKRYKREKRPRSSKSKNGM